MIYLDNAATTMLVPEALEAMLPYLKEEFANPQGAYNFAGEINIKIEKAREEIAELIGAEPGEIFFTAGGSEANNWAIKGTMSKSVYSLLPKQAKEDLPKKNHIITTKIEHHSVLNTCKFLEKMSMDVTYLDVDGEGRVDPAAAESAIKDETALITVMTANNEIGTIEPISEIGEIARAHGVPFHTDAVQALGHIPINVKELGVDMLSASAHKWGGPKGTGFLYIKKGTKLDNLIHGGAQEMGRRAGTCNAAEVIGMAKALQLALENMKAAAEHVTGLRDYLMKRLEDEIPHMRINGPRSGRLPGNVNACFRFVEGESLLMMLDREEICASSASACTSGSLEPSHVLLAIGLPHEIAHGSLRLTLSAKNTEEEIDFTVEAIKKAVKKLRSMSPLYEDYFNE